MATFSFRVSTTAGAAPDASPANIDASWETQYPWNATSELPPPNSEAFFTVPNYDPGPAFHVPPPTQGVPPYSAPSSPPMKQECQDKTVEFVKKDDRPRDPTITAWTQKSVYVCSRQGSGGKSKYCPKNAWTRKVDSKQSGCPCRLTVKSYPGTSEVLGFYKPDHTHAIGDANLKYTRLDADTRKEIETVLRLGVEPKKILENLTQKMYHESNISETRSKKAHQRDFATQADVRRIQKMIEEESIQLAAQDGPSVLEWVDRLRKEGHFCECWEKYGTKFAGIDGTHNMTHYENMTLFTLLVRDEWGHGMPAAWMISSNGKEVTIDYFLATILKENPTISPNHFVTQHFPLLWERLKKWIRITDQAEFDAYWAEIQTLAPDSVVEYLKTYWLPVVHMWSAVYRSDRSIFETCDTNMLVKAWHHLLKGDFLEEKRNRRLDHLIHVLYEVAIPHFIARHRRQEMGFEGPNLELKQRKKVTAQASSILKEDIQYDPETLKFIMRSQSDPEIFYEVDLDAYDCTCLSFPLIWFCKHICAVQLHFPEQVLAIPVSSLTTPILSAPLPNTTDSDSDDEPDLIKEHDTAADAVEALTERLQSLALLFSRQPPLHLSDVLRESVQHATEVLDLLSIDLAPVLPVLPRKVAKSALLDRDQHRHGRPCEDQEADDQ
ncbi:hypothetical protein DFH07DRAFT_764281 [Mycena maculata]|uniref:SWIM-type domain-containing protein n=1 Tax=Mycena maculata TaxID=230809 RepID=A0AAD7P1E2_9AGAR|nr:hypothetical protein DFH07DRAFT_764281 [Mycena maculata]